MIHCACRQESVDLVYHLERNFGEGEVSFHYFRTFKELLETSQRFSLDLIVIGGVSDFMAELKLVRLIKQNAFLSITPTALYHPSPSETTVVTAYQNGVDEFLVGEWSPTLFEARLKMIADRSKRDISVNPSSMLPGPALIEREIERQLALDQEFAVCYSDLDNFKAYNDYYGYYYGDRMIRLTSRIIRDTVFDLCHEGFVGQIGGDDFIFIIPDNLVNRICETIIKRFDTLVPYQYRPEDRKRESIVTRNRRGEFERFGLLTLSVAALTNCSRTFDRAAEMSQMLADLKKYAKSLPGSNYVIERRAKY